MIETVGYVELVETASDDALGILHLSCGYWLTDIYILNIRYWRTILMKFKIIFILIHHGFGEILELDDVKLKLHLGVLLWFSYLHLVIGKKIYEFT